jgi:uncharacterized protein (TIGR02246 family)
MREQVLFLAAFACIALVGCTVNTGTSSDSDAIRALDSRMVATLNSGDYDHWLGFMADEAIFMPPNKPAVVGKPAIRKWVADVQAKFRLQVTHHLTALEVARSADLAYTSYAYEFFLTDSAGKSTTLKGKDLTIFKRQADGSWKLIRDMWSPDSPGQ